MPQVGVMQRRAEKTNVPARRTLSWLRQILAENFRGMKVANCTGTALYDRQHCRPDCGRLVLQQQPLLPDLTGAVVLVPLAALWLLAARRKGAAAAMAAPLPPWLLSGSRFFWSAAIGHWSLAHALLEPWEGAISSCRESSSK